MVHIPTLEEKENNKPIDLSASSSRKKSFQEVKDEAMVLAYYPEREK